MNTKTKLALALLVASATWRGLLAQTTNPPPAKPTATDDEVIQLSPFEVTTTKDRGYAATETLAGTRIRTNLADVGSAIQVITKEFMQDVGATDSGTLLQYTTNAEVAGTRGTYAGLGNGTSVDEIVNLRAPASAQRVRGLAAADNTRDFFVTDIPWDSYNVDRIDIQRGPNSILFGLGSPAGIVNASTRNAEFRNLGSVEARTGSYGTFRTSLDVNQELIDNMLAIRLDGMWNNQKYEQKQAWQNDKRFSGAIRFDPKLFKRDDFHTSIKAKFENGDITADRPRLVPPNDSVTPWFRPVDVTSSTGGMGKQTVNYGYDVGASESTFNPWLASIGNRQQPYWFIDGTSNELYRIYGGFVNTGRRTTAGAVGGQGDALLGQRDSDEFMKLVGYASYANNAKLPGYQYGQFRNISLTDPTVFDFYHNLLDGPTASQFEKWNAYNIDLSQTGWDDRVGLEVTYDRQKYKRGGQNLITDPTLNIDVLKNFQDLTANPNVGRPFVVGGPGSGNSYDSDRKFTRASLFGELRAADFFSNSFLVKLLGKHRFNGVYSDEKYSTENRKWQMFGTSREWDAYWSHTDGSGTGVYGSSARPPTGVIYLGSSIASGASAAGANIPGITAPVTLQDSNVYHFSSTWTNPAGVGYNDPWTVPASLQPMFGATGGPNGGNATGALPYTGYTQASNPANYVGWNNNFQMNLLRYNDGQDLSLLTGAAKSLRVTKSYAGSWQGFLWNDAIVPTLGWRYDEVKSKNVTALPVGSNRQILNIAPGVYKLPDVFPANQIFKDHSTAGGLVVHLNKLLDEHDVLPFNISLSYNKSNNFQVTDLRVDIYGHPIANPTGSTKEYGVLLSTKDGKYSFRAVKYDTSVAGASTQLDLGGLAGAITQGLKFRNVFLYRLNGYTWDTREQTDLSVGKRYWWHPAYVNSAGRPTANTVGSPASGVTGATLETAAQAAAHGDASILAWNEIQKTLDAKGFFSAWGYTPTTLSALTDRTTYEKTLGPNTEVSTDGRTVPAQNNAALVPVTATLQPYGAITPSGLSVTADTRSRGYEFEFVANPLPNWRVAVNASKTEAVRTNVGGPVLDDLVAYMDTQMAGVAGDMRQFNGDYSAGNEVRQSYANWRGQYTLLKLQEGSAASELRKWRYNVITNYSFTQDFLKGVGVGASYRWQDRVVIGYPVIPGTNGQASFDLTKPYFGPSENALDLWLSYERKITKKVNWRIQLNVYNVGKNDKLIPISVEPDGQTWASARIAPVQEWVLTNTFMF